MEFVRIHGASGKARNYLKDELDIDTDNMESVIIHGVAKLETT